jgi:hypothetical protein
MMLLGLQECNWVLAFVKRQDVHSTAGAQMNVLLIILYTAVQHLRRLPPKQNTTDFLTNSMNQIIIKSINRSAGAFRQSVSVEGRDYTPTWKSVRLSPIHIAPQLFLSSLSNVSPPSGISELLQGQFMPSLRPDVVWLFCTLLAVFSTVAGNPSER